MTRSFLHPKSPRQTFRRTSARNRLSSAQPTPLFPGDCALRKVRFFSQLLSFLTLAHSCAKTTGVVLVFLVKNPIPFSEFPSLIPPPPFLLPAARSAGAMPRRRSPRSHLLSITSALFLLTDAAQLPSFQCLPHSFRRHGRGASLFPRRTLPKFFSLPWLERSAIIISSPCVESPVP